MPGVATVAERLTLRNARAYHDPDALPDGVMLLLPRQHPPPQADSRETVMAQVQWRRLSGGTTRVLDLTVGTLLLLRPVGRRATRTPFIEARIAHVDDRSRGRCASVELELSTRTV